MYENFDSIFNAMNNLQEDAFSLDSDGISAYNTFMDKSRDDERNVLSVSDTTADTEADIDVSKKVGELILKCKECNFMFYALQDDVLKEAVEDDDVPTEEKTYMTKDGICPNCKGKLGFALVGVAAPYKATDVKVTVKDDETGETKEIDAKDGKIINSIDDIDLFNTDIDEDDIDEDVEIKEDFNNKDADEKADDKEGAKEEDGESIKEGSSRSAAVKKAYDAFMNLAKNESLDEDIEKIAADSNNGRFEVKMNGVTVKGETTSETKDDELGVDAFDDSNLDSTEDTTDTAETENTDADAIPDDNGENAGEESGEEENTETADAGMGESYNFGSHEVNDLNERYIEKAFIDANPRYESYKVLRVYGSEKKNKLYIEGYAKTASGHRVKEAFVLSPRTYSKGRVSFIVEGAETPTIARGKISDGSLIIESFQEKFNNKRMNESKETSNKKHITYRNI